MNRNVETAKAALLGEHAKEIGRKHPGWTFAQCWQAAQQAHPELAEQFAGSEDGEYSLAASVPAYRYDPAKNVASMPHFKPAPLPKLETLLRDVRKELDPDRPVRIEA